MNDTISIPIKLLNQYFLCSLCKDYYTDPVTLTECLSPHTFCRTCLLEKLKIKFACPICQIYISGDIVHRIYNDELTDRNISGLVDLIPREIKKGYNTDNTTSISDKTINPNSTNPKPKPALPQNISIRLSEWNENEYAEVRKKDYPFDMKLQVKTDLKVIQLMTYVELRVIKGQIVEMEKVKPTSDSDSSDDSTKDEYETGEERSMSTPQSIPMDVEGCVAPFVEDSLSISTKAQQLYDLKRRLDLIVDFIKTMNSLLLEADERSLIELMETFQPSIQLSIVTQSYDSIPTPNPKPTHSAISDEISSTSDSETDSSVFHPCHPLHSITVLINSYSLNSLEDIVMTYTYKALN